MKLRDIMIHTECDYEVRTCDDNATTNYKPEELAYLPVNDIMIENEKLIIHLNCDEDDIRCELGY